MRKLIYALSVLLVLTVSCNNDDDNKAMVKIGAIYPFDANAYVNGECIKSAIDEAELFLNNNSDLSKFEFVEIDNLENDLATIDAVQKLRDQGINHIVAAVSSHDLNAAKTVIDGTDMNLVCPTSTAPYLAQNDNIFRIVPDDKKTANAIANVMNAEGIKKVITIYRDDVWGNELMEEIKSTLKVYSIEQFATFGYEVRFGSDEFPYILEELLAKINETSLGVEKSEVAIQFISFSEGIDLIREASLVDELKEFRWFGGDGFTFNNSAVEDEKIANFLVETNFLSPLVAENETEAFEKIKSSIEESAQMKANSFSMLLYDAAILTGLALEESEGTSTAFKDALMEQGQNNQGVCGNFELNSAGDRISGNYDFWGVTKNNNEFEWTQKIKAVSSN